LLFGSGWDYFNIWGQPLDRFCHTPLQARLFGIFSMRL
jgi:hypothetical protein